MIPAVLFAAYTGLFAADAITTAIALDRGGFREVLLTPSGPANAVILGGSAAGLWWATRALPGRKKWIVRLGIAGLHGAAAIYNVRQLQKGSR